MMTDRYASVLSEIKKRIQSKRLRVVLAPIFLELTPPF